MNLNTILQNLPALFSALLVAILFLQSGLDKVFDFKGNLEWLTGHFSKPFLRGMVLRGNAISFQIEIGAVESHGLVVRQIDARDVPRADLVLGQLRGRNLPVPAAKFAEQLARVLEGMRR